MALNINSTYTNTTSANASYPYGSAKNETSPGALDGTPLEKAGLDDLYGLMQSLLAGAGLVPNGNPDTVLAPQYLESIFNLRWYDKVDFAVGSKVVGSNGVTYVCKQANGPASTVQNPVTEGSPRTKWLTEVSSMFDLLNPVGALYFSHASNSPADLYGVGTWLRIKGRFIAGLDEADTDFNTPGETGGTKTHNHSAATLTDIPITGYGSQQSGVTLPEPTTLGKLITGSGRTEDNENLESLAHATTVQTVAGTTSVSNRQLLPPYQVAYIWRRTA